MVTRRSGPCGGKVPSHAMYPKFVCSSVSDMPTIYFRLSTCPTRSGFRRNSTSHTTAANSGATFVCPWSVVMNEQVGRAGTDGLARKKHHPGHKHLALVYQSRIPERFETAKTMEGADEPLFPSPPFPRARLGSIAELTILRNTEEQEVSERGPTTQ
jgi:hypothetical protein